MQLHCYRTVGQQKERKKKKALKVLSMMDDLSQEVALNALHVDFHSDLDLMETSGSLEQGYQSQNLKVCYVRREVVKYGVNGLKHEITLVWSFKTKSKHRATAGQSH